MAGGSYSHAEGRHTITRGPGQHVQGRFNKEDDSPNFDKYAHIVGNGQSDTQRSNAHTLDWDGNAWYAGDVFNDKYSLNALGAAFEKLEGAGDKDISSQCIVNASGQLVEITVPIDGIAMYSNWITGGFFLGGMTFNGRPPMLLNANISITKYGDNAQKIEGTAELINAFESSNPQFGSVFYGNIEVSLTQDSMTTCAGTIKMTFDLAGEGIDLTVTTYTIYKMSQYYYPIAHLRNDLMERIGALEQRIAELESAR